MEPETQVATDAATQIPASEVVEQPEVTTPEPEQQQPEEKAEDEGQKAIRRMQRRIDAKHAAAAAAEERARLIEQQAQELRQRLAQYEQPQEQQQQVDPVRLAELIATKREIDSKSNRVAEDGKKRFPDFADALKEVAQEVGPLFDANRYGLPTAFGEAVLESDDPAALLHYLGKNPDVAAELKGLSPIQVARKVARIEAQMQAPKEPKQSQAPKALSTVKPASRDDGGLRDDLPIDEWARRFRKMRQGG